jgi:hypothetical protein
MPALAVRTIVNASTVASTRISSTGGRSGDASHRSASAPSYATATAANPPAPAMTRLSARSFDESPPPRAERGAQRHPPRAHIQVRYRTALRPGRAIPTGPIGGTALAVRSMADPAGKEGKGCEPAPKARPGHPAIKKDGCPPITIHWRVPRDPVRGLTAAYQ